jgi:hypothetical protein
MTTAKPFDCIAHKRPIRAKHAEQRRNLSPEEKMSRRTKWLKESDNPAARNGQEARDCGRALTICVETRTRRTAELW